jgi:hypothetical protein
MEMAKGCIVVLGEILNMLATEKLYTVNRELNIEVLGFVFEKVDYIYSIFSHYFGLASGIFKAESAPNNLDPLIEASIQLSDTCMKILSRVISNDISLLFPPSPSPSPSIELGSVYTSCGFFTSLPNSTLKFCLIKKRMILNHKNIDVNDKYKFNIKDYLSLLIQYFDPSKSDFISKGSFTNTLNTRQGNNYVHQDNLVVNLMSSAIIVIHFISFHLFIYLFIYLLFIFNYS